ncbi:MAG: TonB-dependent receptor [Methylococcales bacterium]
MPKINIVVTVLVFFSCIASGSSTELSADIDNIGKQQKQLIKLNLADLLNVEVTSVSKKSQKIAKSAAAIFVITHEDIKRSGVTSIPEALRMAPGIDVAKIDDNEWAISSRGFNGRFANKLLVLIDGRTVYTPFFSGVNWDAQDTLLEDIDRIEVIRGPGASLWGANAVNGVINIISKPADQTQGSYAMTGSGSKEKVMAGFRYGGRIDESISYRLYGKYFERETNENWRMGQGGGRLDWTLTENDKFTLQGDYYQGDVGDKVNIPSITVPYNALVSSKTDLAGGNILMRWNKKISPAATTALQIYYDYTDYHSVTLHQQHSTLDIDFQHSLPLNANNNLIWGVGYRFVSDNIAGTTTISPAQAQIDTHLFSLFVQNEWAIIEDELIFTLGSKFEHNDYSGFEVQPSARIIWTPTATQSIWASVSRAVRTSSRAEQGGVINQQTIEPSPASFNLPVLVSLTGSIGDASEKLIAYELGYRIKPTERVSIDTSVFYNKYKNLRNFEPGAPQFLGTYISLPVNLHTDMSGETYGAELAIFWHALDTWRINATYSYLQMQLHVENGGSNLSEEEEGRSPHHKFSIRSSVDISSSLDWDLWLRYVDTVPDFKVASYITMDTRVAWRPVNALELSVTAQNLLDNQHSEFGTDIVFGQPNEVERSVYGKIEWHF